MKFLWYKISEEVNSCEAHLTPSINQMRTCFACHHLSHKDTCTFHSKVNSDFLLPKLHVNEFLLIYSGDLSAYSYSSKYSWTSRKINALLFIYLSAYSYQEMPNSRFNFDWVTFWKLVNNLYFTCWDAKILWIVVRLKYTSKLPRCNK